MPYILMVKKDDLQKLPQGPRKLFEEHALENNILGHAALAGTLVPSTLITRRGNPFPKHTGKIPWSRADLLHYAAGLKSPQDVHAWVQSVLNKLVFVLFVPDADAGHPPVIF